jgi:hypothetical protein
VDIIPVIEEFMLIIVPVNECDVVLESNGTSVSTEKLKIKEINNNCIYYV